MKMSFLCAKWAWWKRPGWWV